MSKVIKYEASDGQNVELTFEAIKQFLVQGKPDLVTNQEMVYFMGICKSRGLNPFAKDCYLIKYSSDPAAIITSIDFFRSRAKAQPDCKGWESGVIVLRDGEIVYSNGLVLENDDLMGGWFRARPEGWDHDFNLEVNLKGYIKTTNVGKITKFWAPENQPTMIRKVAESQGLRELWPDEFGKIYTTEEVDRTKMRDEILDDNQGNIDKNANQDIIDIDHEGDMVDAEFNGERSPAEEPEVVEEQKVEFICPPEIDEKQPKRAPDYCQGCASANQCNPYNEWLMEQRKEGIPEDQDEGNGQVEMGF